jgi:predicted GH43/DUF377 family glycosyl hydrolase
MRTGASLAAVLLFPSFALAQDECTEAIASYNSAIEEVSNTMKRYSRCVSDSQGHDDCSTEFRRLKSSQSDFEVAVSSYGSECR